MFSERNGKRQTGPYFRSRNGAAKNGQPKNTVKSAASLKQVIRIGGKQSWFISVINSSTILWFSHTSLLSLVYCFCKNSGESNFIYFGKTKSTRIFKQVPKLEEKLFITNFVIFQHNSQNHQDKCCRSHDFCPHWIGSFEQKWSLFNWSINVIMACKCDER